MFLINLILRLYTFKVDFMSKIFIPRFFRKYFYTFFGKVFMKMTENDFAIIENNLTTFKNLKEFFIRKIKMNYRPVSNDIFVCPSDGKILEYGNISDDKLVQVKGINYSLLNLVLDKTLCNELKNGSFVSIYLSPRNYHRFHCPCDGLISSIKHIPGYVLPVNKLGLKVSSLYTRNERFIVTFKTLDNTIITLAIVGATAVSKIKLSVQDKQQVKKGDELGYFELGSSIVMISNKKFNVNKHREDVVNVLESFITVFQL